MKSKKLKCLFSVFVVLVMLMTMTTSLVYAYDGGGDDGTGESAYEPNEDADEEAPDTAVAAVRTERSEGGTAGGMTADGWYYTYYATVADAVNDAASMMAVTDEYGSETAENVVAVIMIANSSEPGGAVKIQEGASITLDLNGYTLANSSDSGSMITVGDCSNGNLSVACLTLTDSSAAQTGTVSNGASMEGSIYVAEGAALNMYGGTITGNCGIEGDGIVNVYGGAIVENCAESELAEEEEETAIDEEDGIYAVALYQAAASEDEGTYDISQYAASWSDLLAGTDIWNMVGDEIMSMVGDEILDLIDDDLLEEMAGSDVSGIISEAEQAAGSAALTAAYQALGSSASDEEVMAYLSEYPLTGDSSDMMLWIAVMAAALAVCAAAAAVEKRQRRRVE